MLFNSLPFAIFFGIVTTAYFMMPQRYRWFWLLAASCYFYMAFVPIYIVILFFTIAVDYVTGVWIEESEGLRRRILLIVSITANIGVLVVFKYFNFLKSSIHSPPSPKLSLRWPITAQRLQQLKPRYAPSRI
ncbi:MAG TPA: hypothetical protein PKA05_14715 [Roseiflexaceae bacterium]|nr:hypothetical protein [Roseiflexaceae bacterium]HMP41629.1 hypothetical protein [Roseiflexaceae bacterium]